MIELLVLMKTPIMELLNSKKNISSIFGNNRYDTSHRDVIKHQISIINIISSLLTVSRWSDVFYIDGKLSFKNWKFENNDHMIFYENLLNGTESERFISIIDQLLTTELNSSRVLQVVASNNVNDIISRISDWNFDVNTLQTITKDNDCIISAVQLKMMFTEWPNNIHMDHSYYRGHILTFDNNEGVIMEKDKRGFIMGNYTLTMPNQLEVKVRFTHIPSSYHIVFNMMELVLEHRIGGFTPILEENISGFKIYAIKMPITNEAINSLLGTTNDNHDAWFIGFTSSLVIGVYIGFDNPKTLGKFETGSKVALPIFKDFIEKALYKEDFAEFQIPENIYLTSLNYDTGIKSLAGDNNVITEALKLKDINNINNNNLISNIGSDKVVKFRQFY